MRILFSTCSGAHYMAPPILSDEQVNCGPFMPDREIGGRYLSLNTAKGDYDLAAVAARLPEAQQPDAVVCLVDASWFNLPQNLAAFKCPKILLVADTHHMTKPILGMIKYASTQPFDRFVFLYTRHHLELFRAAGFQNLHWFPGLTFPHTDVTVQAARQPEREPRIALIGQAGGLHQRRLRLAGALAGAGLPLVFREASQRESLGFYGSSLIGFNATANGDLNLRAFETLSAGSMLLMDRLAPESGLSSLWQDGRDYVGYSNPGELVERARHYIAHPAEARRIGAAGAQWFDTHFNASVRRKAFEHLVATGRDLPLFATPPKRANYFFGHDNRAFVTAVAVYEHIQKLHSPAEEVRVLVDETVPAEFPRICATLPRVTVVRVARETQEEGDLFVTNAARAATLQSLPAPRIWVWDADQAQRAELAARFGAAGLTSIREDAAFFGLPQADAEPATDRIAKHARALLLNCDLAGAMEGARRALQENPRSLEGYLVMAELALETGNQDMLAKMLARARQLAPDEPRIPLLELASRQESARQKPADRLLAIALRHVSGNDLGSARMAAARALKLDPRHATAHHWIGLIALRSLNKFTTIANWREQGLGLKMLRRAAELAPQRPEFTAELGFALHRCGLLEEAAQAFERSLREDPSNAITWFSLGQCLLLMQQDEPAVAVLERGLGHAPEDRYLRTLLGHACKRVGRVDEARAHYQRVFGAPANLRGSWGGPRRRAVFVVQHGPSWTCTESVWREFAQDPAWEAIVVAVPYLHPFYNHAQNNADEIFTFLKEKGVPFVHGDSFPLGPDFADVVFLQNPYDVTRPKEWHVGEMIRHGVRIAYLPYGLEIGGGVENNTMVMNMPLQQMAWRVFARSERQRQSYRDHCSAGNVHVVVSGHPKMDALRDMAQADGRELTEFAAGRKIVAWNPHFDVRLDGTRFGSGFSTFLRWREFLLAEFARRPGLVLALRPHPLFVATLEDRGILTQQQLEDYFARCRASGQIYIDRASSHLPLFAAAHAMMSDISSFVLEFSATGKPLLYLQNPNGPQLNDDADFVYQHLYRAEREDGIRRFLDQVEAGEDPLREQRMQAFPEYMHLPPAGVGPTVKQAIVEALEREGVSCAPELELAKA